jgi:hypothetical protein
MNIDAPPKEMQPKRSTPFMESLVLKEIEAAENGRKK